jgi:hypothetical protein
VRAVHSEQIPQAEVIIVDVFYWITMGATWFVMLMTFWRLKIT